jgi:hypothetical protein
MYRRPDGYTMDVEKFAAWYCDDQNETPPKPIGLGITAAIL